MCRFLLRSRIVWAAAIALVAVAPPDAADAQSNISVATSNVLNLLQPFLTLNSTTTGQQTLTADLQQAALINQNASSPTGILTSASQINPNAPSAAFLNGNLSTTAAAALAISDENALSAISNNVFGISKATVSPSTTFGIAANLAGGLPTQNTTSYTFSGAASGATVYTNGAQPVGGFGAVLGAAYVSGVYPGSGTTAASTSLPNTVTLLNTAFNFTGNATNNGSNSSGDAQVAKFYFANGTWNGTTAAVAPTNGPAVPTFNGLPNTSSSVYDIAFGVSNSQPVTNSITAQFGTYAQNQFGDSHPYQTFQTVSSAYTLYDPTVAYTSNSNTTTVNPDKPSSNPAFPSSHMAYAMTDGLLLGMLVPQFYQSMLMRASQMGESRIIVGVHYPTDIIASRAFIQYDLAQYLSNPAYINNAAVTGAPGASNQAVNLPSLFAAAQPEITTYLNTYAVGHSCGTSLATCATSAANTAGDPFAPSATNAQLYEARLTYGLPILSFAQAPREQAPAGASDASILLAPLYGGSTSYAQTLAPNGGLYGNLSTNTINQIIVNTETNALAAFYGTSLSYWARINLYAAAQYFQGVTGLITLASTDQVNTNVVVAGATTNVNGDVVPAGVLAGMGTINGSVSVASGGTLSPGVPNAPGFLSTPGTLSINGSLAFNSGSIYAVQLAPSATASVTNVNGSVTISSNVQESAYFASGIYAVGSKLPILTATGGVSGTFGSLSFSSGGGLNVVPTLSYDANDAYLILKQAAMPTLPAGSSANAGAVAGTLNSFIAGGGTLPAALQNLYLLSPSAYATTLNQLGSQLGTASTQTATTTTNSFLGLLFDFAGGASGQPGGGAIGFAAEPQPSREVALAYAALTPKDVVFKAPPMPEPQWNLWGAGFGGSTRLDGDPATGSQGLTAQNYGLAAGGNYRINPDAMVGFALAGGGTSFSLDNGFGSGRSDYFLAAGDAKLYLGQAYLAAAIVGGAHGVTTSRTVVLGPTVDNLSASYTMPVVAGRLEGGYRFANAFAGITPYAALQTQAAFVPSYTETSTAGSGVANAVAASTATSTRSELGFWADSHWADLTLRGRLAWAHEFDSGTTVTSSFAVIPGTSFPIVGVQRPPDSALVSAIAEWPVMRNVLLSTRFDG